MRFEKNYKLTDETEFKNKIRKKMDVGKKIDTVFGRNRERIKWTCEILEEIHSIEKKANETGDEKAKKEVLWERNLINELVLLPPSLYKGKLVSHICDKWSHILNSGDFKPFSNLPFCEWKIDAVDYYKHRCKETRHAFAKARYSFAIMVFFSGKERLDWMKKSTENWLKAAEEYIEYKDSETHYQSDSIFAYDFALKLSLSFNQESISKKILDSLHKNAMKIISSGEKKWRDLELFKVESKYINDFDNVDEIKKESVTKIKERVKDLEENSQESYDKRLLRHDIEVLLSYKIEDPYCLDKKIAESYLDEAEARKEPFAKNSDYTDGIKKYKSMLNHNPDKSLKIKKRIEDIALKIQNIPEKHHKQFPISFEISTKELTEEYIKYLRDKGGKLFESFLEDMPIFPKHDQIEMNPDQKSNPLSLVPHLIIRDKEPIASYKEESDISDYHLRRNTLINLNMMQVICRSVFDVLLGNEMERKELFNKIEDLLNQDQLKDIKKTLKEGFKQIFEIQNYIAGLHIIVPYIEEVIRLILKKSGKSDLVLRQDKNKLFRDIELGGLLSNESVKELIGPDFQKSLKTLLVDNDMFNLRNELLHGRMKTNKINDSQTVLLAYFLLKLLKILFRQKYVSKRSLINCCLRSMSYGIL